MKNFKGILFLVFTLLLITSIFTSPFKASATFSFTNTLKYGMTSPEIKELQKFLNANGFIIATQGAGSLGHETTFFGAKTKQAIILFQKAQGLIGDGVIGPKTRGHINTPSQILPPPTTHTPPTTPNPNPSYNQTNLYGCTSNALYNTTTGLPCGTPPVLPTGCTSGSLFSTTSGLSCTTGLPPTPTTPIIKISGGGSSNPSIQKISNRAITGVTVPAGGAMPTSSIASTHEYTATISWDGNPTVFFGNTAYTAVITITPKSGYTLTGITENFFSVSGAVTTNAVDSGIVTAVFPATPQVQLTISNPTITTQKVYDGNTTAVATPGTLSGKVGSDDVSINTTVATYDNKNVGTNKTITVVYTLAGADKDKYIKPADYTVSTGVITAIQLIISNPTLTTSKEYDRTTSSVVTAGTLSGVVDGGVTVTAVANYDTLNRGEAKMITVVYTLSGANAGNYIKPVDRIVYSGVITQKQLTISTPSLTTTKLYDQNTTASVTPGTLSGIVGTEDVSISSTTATYDNANVGTGKTITVVYTITGADSANYLKPVNYTPSTGVITAIQLTIASPSLTLSKPYDGTTSAVVIAGSLTGILGGDTVTVTGVATYDTSSMGTGKTITVVYTLGGAQTGNYTKPVNYTTSSGVITEAIITTAIISGVTLPVTGATPVTTITESDQYTGTVTWNTSPVTFASNTIYTATITLTAKTGYTLTGVSANLFTVAGTSTPATNSQNSGVISAVFPVTATTINVAAISGATAPAVTATPVSSIVATSSYTATISWSPSPVTFASSTVYTATITLTPKTGYTLAGVPANFFTVSGTSTPATNFINSGIITAVFPATATTPDYAVSIASAILAVGSTNSIAGVINVTIPATNGTDTTGQIRGWTTNISDIMKFTITDGAGGTSTITINGSPYTSGDDYQVLSAGTLPIVVTTSQSGKLNAVKTFNVSVITTVNIGDSYRGGKVAYILVNGDPGYDAGTQHGLIAATSNQSSGIRWYNGSNTTTGATATAIGTGLGNTNAIIASQGATATSYAAGLARAYTGGGYTDWFLSSKDEMYKLYLNKNLIGILTGDHYATSSEISSSTIWSVRFANQSVGEYSKDTSYSVRAIRVF